MKHTWLIAFTCVMLGGCNTKPAPSFSIPSEIPGTQLRVFLSDAVVRQGESTSVVFEFTNTTNTNVEIIDALCGYWVQPNLDPNQGKLVGAIIPMDACPEFEPGRTQSHAYPVFTDPAQLTEGISDELIKRGKRRDGLLFTSPGVHKIGISQGDQRSRPHIAVLELEIKEK